MPIENIFTSYNSRKRNSLDFPVQVNSIQISHTGNKIKYALSFYISVTMQGSELTWYKRNQFFIITRVIFNQRRYKFFQQTTHDFVSCNFYLYHLRMIVNFFNRYFYYPLPCCL